MIYVVSGFARTGTSMMMDCLSAGGLAPAFDPARDRVAEFHSDEDYHPNPNGMFELGGTLGPDFPLQYQGRLIKVMQWHLPFIAANQMGYRIVLMHRDPTEIRQSYEAFFDRPIPNAGRWVESYEKRFNQLLHHMRNRKDIVTLDVLNYREVIGDAFAAFRQLANSGWPIDTFLSTTRVDKSLCRFRVELLDPTC